MVWFCDLTLPYKINKMKKIAIIGATGMLGQPVTKAFIEAGFEVSLLVRHPEKARQLFGPAPQLVTGDVQDTNSIRKFLQGQDALYLNLSVAQASSEKDFQPEREGLENILKAAKSSSIKRIGYLSSLVHLYQGQNGFNWWAFALKKKAVADIKASGLTYSIFYPSTFMESLDKGGYRQGNSIALAGTSRHKMFFISGSDYARQVVKAFERNQGNQEYTIQGPEGYTADEAAKLFVSNYKKAKLKVQKAPLGLLRCIGLFVNKLNYGANIVDALNNYPEKFESEKTWQELGQPQTRVIDYAKNA